MYTIFKNQFFSIFSVNDRIFTPYRHKKKNRTSFKTPVLKEVLLKKNQISFRLRSKKMASVDGYEFVLCYFHAFNRAVLGNFLLVKKFGRRSDCTQKDLLSKP